MNQKCKSDLTGKVAIITGSSSGIGAATARELARRGAIICLTGMQADELAQVAKECMELSPQKQKPLTSTCDLRNEKDMDDLIASTINTFGRLDILINNAGTMSGSNIQNTSMRDFESAFGINVRTPYYLTMLAVPHLIKSKGCIVTTSSVAGLAAFPDLLAYGMAKAAMDQFTKCCASSLGPKGVRVNAISPGYIITNLHRGSINLSKDDVRQIGETANKTTALRRAGQPEEMAKTIAFLVSDDASYITGVNLVADGGFLVGTPDA